MPTCGPLPVSIQDGTRLKKRLRRQWQVMRDIVLKAVVNRLQRSVTYWLNEWRNKQWSETLEFLNREDQSLWKMTKTVTRVPHSLAPLASAGRIQIPRKRKPWPTALRLSFSR
jgi:hypothetical protein